MTGYASAAAEYVAKGWAPLPVAFGQKRGIPSGATGHDGTVTAEKVERWMSERPDDNLAVRAQGWIGIDVDDPEELAPDEALLGPLPVTYSSTSRGQGSARRTYFYEVPPMRFVDEKLWGEVIQFHHRYSVVWPSFHPETGAQYQFYGPDGEPCDVPNVADLERLPEAWIDYLRAPEARDGDTVTVEQAEGLAWDSGPAERYLGRTLTSLRERLDALPRPWHDGAGWDAETFAAACILRRIAQSPWFGMDGDAALRFLRQHAPTDAVWTLRDVDAKWASAARSTTGQTYAAWCDFVKPADDEVVEEPDEFTPDPEEVRKMVKQRVNREEADRVFASVTSEFGLPSLADLRTPADLASSGEVPALIEGVMLEDEVTMLFGRSYSGKSYLALAWAFCAAAGIPWEGRAVAPSRVLYAAMEGAAQIPARIAALEDHYGIPAPEGLVVLPRVVNLIDRKGGAALADLVRQGEFDLVVVDTLNWAFGGAKEEESAPMSAFLQSVARIREARPRCGVLLIHHSKKDAHDEYRGHSSLFSGVDNVLCLEMEDERNPARALRWQKLKSGTLPPPLLLRFDGPVLRTDEFGHLRGDVVVQTLAELLSVAPEVTQSMLAAQLVGSGAFSSVPSAETAIGKRVTAGKIVKTGTGGAARLMLA